MRRELYFSPHNWILKSSQDSISNALRANFYQSRTLFKSEGRIPNEYSSLLMNWCAGLQRVNLKRCISRLQYA
ncbi:hypothetical protein ACHQM5_006200 [Ranunculus cassubicifolius]